MTQLLKQSTAYTFRLGPFLDSTDGNTQENALTIAAADVLLSKAGAALAAKNEATALTGTGVNAHYTCILNTTDTGTLGTLRVWCHVTGALAVWQDFMVAPANVYDSIVAGSDLLDANSTQWAGVATATDDVAIVTAPTNFALLSINGSGYVTEVNVDGIKKNTALSNFEFLMVDATDGYTEETGLSVTAQRSIDGAAFGACANAVTEVSNGIYKINLAAADLNGDVITLRFSATGARTRLITIKTNT